MESREIARERPEQQPKETILVKRGLFYFIGEVIIFPFKLLALGANIVLGYLSIYFDWIKESQLISKKKKKLNRYMTLAKDDEVI